MKQFFGFGTSEAKVVFKKYMIKHLLWKDSRERERAGKLVFSVSSGAGKASQAGKLGKTSKHACTLCMYEPTLDDRSCQEIDSYYS